MNDEKGVLDKVRRSLGRTAPLEKPPAPPVLDERLVRLVLSDIGLPQLFEKKAKENKIGVSPVRVDDLHEELLTYLKLKHVKSVALPKSAFLDRLGIADALRANGIAVKIWGEATVDDLYDVDAGITDVYRVVAETGSLVIKASPEHGRSLSLVPPIHIAIVEPKNCVGDLVDLFELSAKEGVGSATILISGPSKTSDIEMNLVTGVHGPVTVQVFLLK